MVKFEEIQYGFKWGDAEITRIFSDDKKGSVVIQVSTSKKKNLQIYVTKTGKVRLFYDNMELTMKAK
jgi:hypothetical protein